MAGPVSEAEMGMSGDEDRGHTCENAVLKLSVDDFERLPYAVLERMFIGTCWALRRRPVCILQEVGPDVNSMLYPALSLGNPGYRKMRTLPKLFPHYAVRRQKANCDVGAMLQGQEKGKDLGEGH